MRVTAIVAQKPEARKELTAALTDLLRTLQSVAATPVSVDAKLAEYVFVPISQVLRLSQQVPVHALELCLQCIMVLLETGWGSALESALSTQLLILFTFLAKPSSAGSGIVATSDELQSLAFQCMTELFRQTSRSRKGKEALTIVSNIPALGEAVLVVLDGLVESKSSIVRLNAVATLAAVVDCIGDDDTLASFLPRMVSLLTKILTPSSTNRPSFRVVELGLKVLSTLLTRLLSDKASRGLPKAVLDDASEVSTKTVRSIPWLQATASQIKIALGGIFKLRDHDKAEVRKALLVLCLCVVQDCRESLAACVSMAFETLITLSSQGDDDSIDHELRSMITMDPALRAVIQESLHGWVISLPRIMQSKDDQGRRQAVQRISVALRLFEEDPSVIDEKLADSICDGISAVLSDTKGLEELEQPMIPEMAESTLILTSSSSVTFQPLRLRLKGQDDMMTEFRVLIHEVAKSTSALTVLQALVQNIESGPRDRRLASFWGCVTLLRDITSTGACLDDFIDLGAPSRREELLDQVYTQSLTILTDQNSSTDLSWHFYALALEVVAMQASRYRSDFRPELSDVLYPVLHYLGSANDALRAHALTCLNILANECGYDKAAHLVIGNADYVVNAVGLKLAVGDVSPQAPQVLLMVMRLCGPPILPYLDDLVGSIFDALERYHGYTRLTELLFAVLKGMAEEGVKAPQLAITAKEDTNFPSSDGAKSMTAVIESIKKLEIDTQKRKEEDDKHVNVPVPQEPWSKKSVPVSDTQVDDQQQVLEVPEALPPVPRTFDILLKISEFTQHYLTTESTSLRTSLLSLLNTTIPALAKHENSFLPLINTLWPVLLPRLQDSESYVVSNALDTISMMCEYAEDFMRSRIDSAWSVLMQVYRRTQKRSESRNKNDAFSSSHNLKRIEIGIQTLSVEDKIALDTYRPEKYVDAPTRMIWNSLVGLLCCISRHVSIREDLFNQILDILGPVLETSNVRQALEARNADAVWLRLYRKDMRLPQVKRSDVEGNVELLSSKYTLPQGRPGWQFVTI